MAATGCEPLLIGEVFRRNAEVVPEAVAASLGEERLSHAELDDLGNRTAADRRAKIGKVMGIGLTDGPSSAPLGTEIKKATPAEPAPAEATP